jgi:hypothetical protein
MQLADQILDLLAANTGRPQSVAEIAAAIPGAAHSDVEQACNELRAQGRLGRNGANTDASPYRFYLKRGPP